MLVGVYPLCSIQIPYRVTELSGTNNNLNSVHFTNSTNGYIVGDNGTILKTTQGPVGIKEINKIKSEFVVYPNPSTDIITINSTLPKGNLFLYNVTGSEFKKLFFTTNNFNLDISDIAPGIYLIKIISEKGVALRKIVKE